MDRYQVATILAPAQGGDILLCRHKASHVPYVIKRIARTPSTKDNIAMELHAYSLLHDRETHLLGADHVLQMAEVFEEKKQVHLVLEYCARGEFYNLLKAQPHARCEASEAQGYFGQIAQGLYYMHDHGVAHRDLSLENIFVDGNGALKIGDFGLAVSFPSVAAKACGKLYYMAPEMHTHPDGYDPSKVDLWSLGIVLWMLLTGLPLVSNSSIGDETFLYLQRHGLRALVRAWQLTSLVPDDALDLLERLLVADPAKRLSMPGVLKHRYCAATSVA
ncbi:serine/threonine protein kinase [Saprolegnia diclina VS20]|uniref:Serine/threonine protein kinase n=1 Tax=Saprolegnia diclina (strain VS20) TaxID=1156394 RepID=T0S9L9_SAPDV|nr:serine/threonine protein kinase [Saprolegnia diclina VS20]EQC39442.1 serine/threonine protein kinase [Saprolegnia diclina VS20]|eukprot:XP_008607503.1 serine/threonine protein kinase [Saprolegnia diclina VS20]